jgi:Zn-dependent M28 family amino/carboxypeptidase
VLYLETSLQTGCDDNASGTAAVIAIGGYLSKLSNRRYGVVLLITDAEERGLSGARMFCRALPGGLSTHQIAINLNFDMLSHPNVVGHSCITHHYVLLIQ